MRLNTLLFSDCIYSSTLCQNENANHWLTYHSSQDIFMIRYTTGILCNINFWQWFFAWVVSPAFTRTSSIVTNFQNKHCVSEATLAQKQGSFWSVVFVLNNGDSGKSLCECWWCYPGMLCLTLYWGFSCQKVRGQLGCETVWNHKPILQSGLLPCLL